MFGLQVQTVIWVLIAVVAVLARCVWFLMRRAAEDDRVKELHGARETVAKAERRAMGR